MHEYYLSNTTRPQGQSTLYTCILRHTLILRCLPLLGPLVYLGQETPEDLLLHPATFLIDSLDQGVNPLIRLLFVRLESLRDGNGSLRKDLFDLGFGSRVFLTVVGVENSTLFRGGVFQGSVDVPRAFVVLAISVCTSLCIAIECIGLVLTKMSVPIFPMCSGRP